MFDFTVPLAAQSLDVIQRLQQAGFVAYFAGGCVRDALLKREPKDFDVATDASPETVRHVFGKKRTLAYGASFGVIGVLGPASVATEVATFRSDGEYSDGRRPDTVRYGTAEHDAQRRDFTINGMFYDPVSAKLIDFVGGEADLQKRMIRAIGEPQRRIHEDKLRMLRAVRFAASLAFQLDELTADAIRQCAPDVSIVSGERIGAEMRRMSVGTGARLAFELLHSTRLLAQVWPQVSKLFERDRESCLTLIQQSAKHSFEVVCAGLLAMLGECHPAEMNELAQAWKLSCDEQRAISQACDHYQVVLSANQLPWSVLQPLVASRDASTIIGLAESWAHAFDKELEGVDLAWSRFRWPREQLDPLPLLTGDTLRKLGYRPGPQFGPVLQATRDAQLDNKLLSEADAIVFARRLLDV